MTKKESFKNKYFVSNNEVESTKFDNDLNDLIRDNVINAWHKCKLNKGLGHIVTINDLLSNL